MTDSVDISFAALICWDFVDEADEDKLEDSLAKLYGAEVHSYSGARMGGGGWTHQVAGNEVNEFESETDFESIRTIIQRDVDGVIDVTTIAILSSKQIEAVLESENRSKHRKLRSTLDGYLEELPSLLDRENTGFSGATYAEWDGEIPLIPEKDEVELEEIVYRLQDQHSSLYPFGFQTGGVCSLISHSVFVAPQTSMQPFDGLTAIRRSPHQQAESFDELVLEPPWYHEVSAFQRYYRLKLWADDRWAQLHDFDDRVAEARTALGELGTEAPIADVIDVSGTIQTLQADFVRFQTRYDAEYESQQGKFTHQADEQTGPFGTPFDTGLPRVDVPDEVDDSTEGTNSVVEYFEQNSSHTFDQVEELADRVSRSILRLVDSIESRTRLSATEENLELQSRVTRLTYVLTGLTVVLVLLTVLLVVIEFV